jgi:hypothetical protein
MEKFYRENNVDLNITDRSTAPLNKSIISSKSRKVRPGNEVIQELKKIEKMTSTDDVIKGDAYDVNVSEGIMQESPDDFGYFVMNQVAVETEDDSPMMKKEDPNKKYYHIGNLVSKFNDPYPDIPGSPMELLLELLKENIENVSKINIENPILVKERQKSTTATKKYTSSKTNRGQDQDEEQDLIKNTENSQILIAQKEFLKKNQHKEALLHNSAYNLRKVTYEINIIKHLINKYHLYVNKDNEKKNKKVPIHLTSEQPYILLKETTVELLKEYDEFLLDKNPNKPAVRTALQSKSIKARPFLTKFMQGIITAYEESMNEKRAANEKLDSYIKWKTKLSQLVGLWDISNSNGIQMKTSIKYLIFKKFLILRSYSRQNDITMIKFEEDKKKDLLSNTFLKITGTRNPLLHPVGILKQGDFIRIIMDSFVFLFLLYSFITVPIRLFMGIENTLFQTIEKFVDMYFYINIMVTFRTAFKDKYNEDRFDIWDLTFRYLKGFFIIDFISTIPWYFFFQSYDIADLIRIVTHIFKICRIVSLLPIINSLEDIKQANYIRLLKLILIFYLIAHWMAGILFLGVFNSVNYNILNKRCYLSSNEKTKYNLQPDCTYVFSFYNAAYTIPGQYNSYMNSYTQLNSFNEYIILLLEFLIGQFLSAYVFGGMTGIIQNLDQGSNFFVEKTDLLREHLIFYEMGQNVQDDVTVYYDYLWQQHKDMIYGKHHFDLLSKSLREKFENFNLLGNEIYLKTFHKLRNPKLLGNLLRELRKVILLPYEILFEEGSLVKGLYILINGDLEFSTNKSENSTHITKSVYFEQVMHALEVVNDTHPMEYEKMTENMTVIFPLVSLFLKTGRTYQRCASIDFTDLLYMNMKAFDDIVASFPVEMHSLKHDVMSYVENNKIFESNVVFNIIRQHSARSVGKNYEKDFNKLSIWIPIPIPISQRKIATNYIESFVKKVKNQWREIMLNGDMNITLNSTLITSFIKVEKIKNKETDDEEKNAHIQNGDILDSLKGISRVLSTLAEDFNKLFGNEA